MDVNDMIMIKEDIVWSEYNGNTIWRKTLLYTMIVYWNT